MYRHRASTASAVVQIELTEQVALQAFRSINSSAAKRRRGIRNRSLALGPAPNEPQHSAKPNVGQLALFALLAPFGARNPAAVLSFSHI